MLNAVKATALAIALVLVSSTAGSLSLVKNVYAPTFLTLDLPGIAAITVPGKAPVGPLGTIVSPATDTGFVTAGPPCSFGGGGSFPAAGNSLDHFWVHPAATPSVWDMGSATHSAIVFPAVDHAPAPYESLEFTVWGSSSSDTSTFPAGWTQATLTTVYRDGWTTVTADPTDEECDDHASLWVFSGSATFRFIAVYAAQSVTIFADAAHTTWDTSFDDGGADGWQSSQAEIDAVGIPAIVGGEILPVDTTSLFIAGAFTNTFWILPMLSGIAGAVIAVTRFRRRKVDNQRKVVQ